MPAPIETVDLTPTWSALLPALIAALCEGTPAGQAIARRELISMAQAADAAVALRNAARQED
jgi:hypothetical protein